MFRNSFSAFFLVLIISLFCGKQARGQVFKVSEPSSNYLTDADFDSLILEKATPLAASKQISIPDFRNRYPQFRERLAEILSALLRFPFSEIDRSVQLPLPTHATSTFAKTRIRYCSEISKAIERALENPVILHPLFSADFSDRILSFHTDIRVQTDGKLQVTENIRIYNGNGSSTPGYDNFAIANNDDIKRGIVRDFPTRYRNKNGYWTTTGFDLKGIYKNDRAEPYVLESLSNGVRIKAGSQDILLDPGIYTYRIGYTTDRQLIFHPGKDELYWNVNGNGWVFTADSISCTISFPEEARILEEACYTGLQGSAARACTAVRLSPNIIRFSGMKRFEPYEGLTVAVSVEKGVLTPPGKWSTLADMLRANAILPALSLVLVILSGFYYYTWRRKGKDPARGTIFPQFEPPAALSPADTGYILDQQFSSRLFAATLVDAAVHRDLEIEVSREGKIFASTAYHFKKPGAGSSAETSADPHRYGIRLDSLYGQTLQSGKYNPTIRSLYQELQQNLKDRFLIRSKGKPGNKGLFALNRGYGWAGTAVIIFSLIGSVLFTVNYFTKPVAILTAILLVLIIGLHVFFSRIMSSYSPEGRAVADHILGFKMYLGQAEQKIYDQLTPPEKTLALFEKYLPYAIALDFENQWAEKFEGILQEAIASGYRPAYYSGLGGFGRSFSVGAMSQSLSSGLSGTISSASTPPSSSSGGSGGGGSSGGGGGGGGGGGW